MKAEGEGRPRESRIQARNKQRLRRKKTDRKGCPRLNNAGKAGPWKTKSGGAREIKMGGRVAQAGKRRSSRERIDKRGERERYPRAEAGELQKARDVGARVEKVGLARPLPGSHFSR